MKLKMKLLSLFYLKSECRMHVRDLARMHRHKQESREYPNINASINIVRTVSIMIRSSTASSRRSTVPVLYTILCMEEFLVDTKESVVATFNALSGAPILYRKKSFLITRRLSTLLHNVGALPSYVHHIS
jgi:hypothetical protein